MSEAATPIRGTIVQIPGDSRPGLIVADRGKQISFHLAGTWQSAVAPEVNQSVEVALDPAGTAIRIVVVDAQRLAKEKFDKAQAIVREKFGRQASGHEEGRAGTPENDGKTYAARMGNYAMICCAALVIAWFCLPVVSVTGDMLVNRKGLSVSDLLGMSENLKPVGHFGFFGFLGLAAVLSPWATPLMRSRAASLFFFAPLVMLIVTVVRVMSKIHDLGEARKFALGVLQPQIGFGIWIVLILCLLVAGIGAKRHDYYKPR